MTLHRSRTTALLAAAALAAALSACSGGSSAGTPSAAAPTSSSAPATSSAAPSPTETTEQPSPTTSSPAAQGKLVEITVAKNKVTGPKGRVKVKLGDKVTLRVTSDVADEIHLHGYDKHADVEKGGTADLTFTANVAGVFEVELESRALQLVQLQVQ